MISRAGAAMATGALALVSAGLAGGCSDTGGKDAFCDRVADAPQITETLALLDASDPGGSRRRLEETVADFRSLEADAPGEIRSDVARLRQGVEVVVEAVKDNPDDLSAARQAILGRQDEMAGLAQAGVRVADYARTECSVDLVDAFDGSAPTETETIERPISTDGSTATEDAGSSSTDGEGG